MCIICKFRHNSATYVAISIQLGTREEIEKRKLILYIKPTNNHPTPFSHPLKKKIGINLWKLVYSKLKFRENDYFHSLIL